jgi:hypothetical protein
MKYATFAALLPEPIRSCLSSEALIRWHRIYVHIFATGHADRFDNELSKKLDYPSDATISRTLKQMAEAGLLQKNRVVVKYTEIGLAFLGIGMRRMEGPPPGAFFRYTLPGLRPHLPLLERKSSKPSRAK